MTSMNRTGNKYTDFIKKGMARGVSPLTIDDTKVEAKIDLGFIILNQILISAELIKNADPRMSNSIEALQIVLTPYEDLTFKRQLKELEKQTKPVLQKMELGDGSVVDEKKYNTLISQIIKSKLRYITQLAYRKGIYPALSGMWGADSDYAEIPYVTDIRTRLHRKKMHAIVGIFGESGTCKSYTGLSIAQDVDVTFTPESLKDRIIFTPEDFAHILSDEAEKRLPRGAAIMFDEAGVGMMAREFASLSNRVVSKILQTMRYRRLLLIMTTPEPSFLDLNARKALSYQVHTSGPADFARQVNKVRFYGCKWNDKRQMHYLRLLKDPSTGNKISSFEIKKADDDICKEYEKLAKAYKDKIMKESHEQLQEINEAKVPYSERRKIKRREEIQSWVDRIKNNLQQWKPYINKETLAIPRARLMQAGASRVIAEIVRFEIADWLRDTPTILNMIKKGQGEKNIITKEGT